MSETIGASGREVLVVENELVIGLDLADGLTRLGYRIAGPFGFSAEALGWLESHTPDLAIVDLGLADGTGLDVARNLRRRGVPFVVFSGASLKDQVDGELLGMPWIEKPATLSHVVRALERAGIDRASGPDAVAAR